MCVCVSTLELGGFHSQVQIFGRETQNSHCSPDGDMCVCRGLCTGTCMCGVCVCMCVSYMSSVTTTGTCRRFTVMSSVETQTYCTCLRYVQNGKRPCVIMSCVYMNMIVLVSERLLCLNSSAITCSFACVSRFVRVHVAVLHVCVRVCVSVCVYVCVTFRS